MLIWLAIAVFPVVKPRLSDSCEFNNLVLGQPCQTTQPRDCVNNLIARLLGNVLVL